MAASPLPIFYRLPTAQIASLGTAQVAALTTADIVALTPAQAHALHSAEIAALTTAQAFAFETADLAALTTSAAHAFTSTDLAAMTPNQIDSLISATPIMLDLGGNGIQTVSAAHGVSFDLNGTGHAQQVGWMSGTTGLLVMDLNGDGLINNGSELFGSGTLLVNGAHAANGYQALAALDTNHDGVLNAADDHYKDLKVWVDANHNGKTDSGELHSLAELGIVSLNLKATATDQGSNGNWIGMVSSYTTADGHQHQMADVWLTKNQTSNPPPTLNDLLAAPHADLVAHLPDPASSTTANPTFTTPAAMPATTDASVPVALPSTHATRPLDDELLTHHLLI